MYVKINITSFIQLMNKHEMYIYIYLTYKTSVYDVEKFVNKNKNNNIYKYKCE